LGIRGEARVVEPEKYISGLEAQGWDIDSALKKKVGLCATLKTITRRRGES
jgi:hypothetical protein